MTPVISKPSSLLGSIRVEKVDSFNLFKFDDELQVRMEDLLERKKADLLTSEEVMELEAIGELDRIFTHVNAMLVAQGWPLLTLPENSSDDGQTISVNTARTQGGCKEFGSKQLAMIVVSNTSPISNLATIGQLGLLQQLYGNFISAVLY